jgi:hypothetical protein
MSPNVDPAIIEALGLEATSSKLVSHGSSGFSSTYKLVATKGGKELTYFVKTSTGPDAKVMFRGKPPPAHKPIITYLKLTTPNANTPP